MGATSLLPSSNTSSSNEVDSFIQTVFAHNEDLGFLPFRVDGNGRRVISKAYIKKTVPQTLKFDIDNNSITLTKNKKDGNIWNLNFAFDSLLDIIVEIYFKATEKRLNSDMNKVTEIKSEQKIETFKFGSGNDQTLPVGHCIVNMECFNDSELVLTDNYTPLLIKIMQEKSPLRLKEINALYIYVEFAKIKGKWKLTTKRKGIETSERFLWIKNVYDSSKTAIKQDKDDGFNECCTICYSNKINTLILPCRHMVLCDGCAKQLKDRYHKCPICRSGIGGFIKLSDKERNTLLVNKKEKSSFHPSK